MSEGLAFKESLGSDNHSGIHPNILKALLSANTSHSPSYGQDILTERCQKAFQENFGSNSFSFLVFNGSAANVACLKALTKSYEAVICSDQAHLHLDECGAPEFHLGVKLLTLPSSNGKITPTQIEKLLVRKGDQHHVQPGVVSITQPTELGVCYSLEEMKKLREVTKKHGLRLHIDGARLANAAHFLNCSFQDLTQNIGIDALSFGGTKNGLLGAEAVVFWDENQARDFKFYRKQLLQLPSKMRFLSAQFLAYFENDLWKKIASHSHSCAQLLAEELKGLPEIQILHPVQSNAVFARIPKSWTKPLKEEMFFYIWDERDWSCRFMTSFDSNPEKIKMFVQTARRLKEAHNGQ